MFDRILACIDLNDESTTDTILPVAEELADKHNSELHVLTVLPSYSMSIVGSFFPEGHENDMLETARQSLTKFLHARPKREPETQGHVTEGTIYDEIMRIANKLDCDLIVLAAHRPEFSDYLLGPNAARVVRHAKQSVFVIRTGG